MSPAVWGAVLGAVAACGVLLILTRAVVLRRPSMQERVLHYVRVAPLAGARREKDFAPTAAAVGIARPWLTGAAERVDRVLGGSASVRRRLVRSGSEMSVTEFRVHQVLWGLGGFVGTAALGLLTTWRDPASWVFVMVGCLAGALLGVMLCDHQLSARATTREARMVEEFPIVAELLALAVAAGEGPVQALTRVVSRTVGPLSDDLALVLAGVRTGQPLGEAFEAWGARTGLVVVSRFARSVAVAVERGTPLADVLHAQVGDVREANRRALIESAARREVAMMVPVVFLVLPTVVLFAFYPGLMGLRLSVS